MTNYVFAYSGGNGVAADEAERNAQYAKWGQWFGELGSAVVEGGAATGTAKTVGPGGSVSDGGSRGLTGYSIVSADSLDSAVELAMGCPVLEIGVFGQHPARRGRVQKSDARAADTSPRPLVDQVPALGLAATSGSSPQRSFARLPGDRLR
jgi:hypothetical protein